MKVKLKDKLSRVLSLLLVVNMVLALVIATDTYYFDSGNTAYAAGTSSTMGSDNYTAKANITIGSRYSFGGYTWIAAQDLGNNTIALQSTGVTHGYWPGYAMAKFGGNANSYYNQDITGQDISGFDAKTQALYNTISYAQSGNSGLYLVSNAQAGSTSNGSSGSGYYWTALKEAATNYSSFGSPNGCAWLGTVDGGGVRVVCLLEWQRLRQQRSELRLCGRPRFQSKHIQSDCKWKQYRSVFRINWN